MSKKKQNHKKSFFKKTKQIWPTDDRQRSRADVHSEVMFLESGGLISTISMEMTILYVCHCKGNKR